MVVSEPVVLLVDNGSSRAAATRALRDVAQRLSVASGWPISPVSLQHADKVPLSELDGVAAEVLPAFLGKQLEQGRRRFVVLPLFFGRSRALTGFIPQQLELLTQRFGAFELKQAAPLSPLPEGEPRLARILADHVQQCTETAGRNPDRVIVVDHGSPIPQVTAVREHVAEVLQTYIPAGIAIDQAVMEKRIGAEYDFNGLLLTEQLAAAVTGRNRLLVVVAMLFLLPGRHAGAGGDIADICRDAEVSHPGLEVRISPLVGNHPLLIDILKERLDAVL